MSLPLKFVLPPYDAVMLCVATLSDAVVNVDAPPVSVPVPKVVAPSLKVTVPDGVPLPGATAVTFAVNVTDWPNTDGLADELIAVVVLALLTVSAAVPLLVA